MAGKFRELGNVLERAAIMAGGELIRPEHLLLEEEPLATASQASKSRCQWAEREYRTAACLIPRRPTPDPRRQTDEAHSRRSVRAGARGTADSQNVE